LGAGVEDGLDDAMEAVGVIDGGLEEFEMLGGEGGGGVFEEEVEGHLDGGERVLSSWLTVARRPALASSIWRSWVASMRRRRTPAAAVWSG